MNQLQTNELRDKIWDRGFFLLTRKTFMKYVANMGRWSHFGIHIPHYGAIPVKSADSKADIFVDKNGKKHEVSFDTKRLEVR